MSGAKNKQLRGGGLELTVVSACVGSGSVDGGASETGCPAFDD
jgi:hypothetical protein